jgi:hypothetical protein
MPGGRLAAVRPGDSAELLAEFILSTMAFCTRAPRQDDVGHDLFCVLYERDSQMLRAGPFFTVQVKTRHEPLIFAKDHEIAWIKNQENPFFLCVVNRERLEIELYSTWNMQNGFLLRGANRILLVPGRPDDNHQEVTTADDRSEQVVPLGRPILRASASEVMDEARAAELGAVLKGWVALDRENLVRKSAGMYWVAGPSHYETNRPLTDTPDLNVWFYWNPLNLAQCESNFGLVATALRLVLRRVLGAEGEAAPENIPRIRSLDGALIAFAHCLNPLAVQTLCEHVQLEITGHGSSSDKHAG